MLRWPGRCAGQPVTLYPDRFGAFCRRLQKAQEGAALATHSRAAATRKALACGLAFGQLDPSAMALSFWLLRNRHFQDAPLELGLSISCVDSLRQFNGPIEVTVAAFRVIIVTVLLFLLDLLLALDGEHIVGHRDLYVLRVETRQLGGDPNLFVSFADIDSRLERSGLSTPRIQRLSTKKIVKPAVQPPLT